MEIQVRVTYTTLNKATEMCYKKLHFRILKAVCTLSQTVPFRGAENVLNPPQMEYLEKFHLVHSNEMMGPQLLSEWPGMSWIAGCLLVQMKSVGWVRVWTCPMIESVWCIGLNILHRTKYASLLPCGIWENVGANQKQPLIGKKKKEKSLHTGLRGQLVKTFLCRQGHSYFLS